MSSKDTNPKDAVGIKKVPFSVLCWNVMAEVAVGMAEGALKYGRHNYRRAGIRESVYFDATLRHLVAYMEGEDIDAESGMSHLTKAMCSLMVWRDAKSRDVATDDRPPKTLGFFGPLNDRVAALVDKYKDKQVTHVTQELLDEQAREQLHQEREQAAPAEATLREDQQSVSTGDGGSLVLGSDVRLMDRVQVDRVPAELDVHFSGFEPDAATLAQRAA